VSGRQDEAIAIEPIRVSGIVAQRVPEENGADLGAAEREAEVSALAGVHGVEREAPSDGGGLRENFFGQHGERHT
jgi:hypothetical protein